MIRPAEVDALLADIESDRIEFIQSTTDTRKFSEAVCAFANDMANHRLPGYLVIGVDDRTRTVANVVITDSLLQTLASLRNNGTIQPMPRLIVEKLAKPVKAYQRWIDRIPASYRDAVLGEAVVQADIPTAEADPYRLALLKNYRSLMPMAMDAHKPMFQLRSSDGAIGAHIEAVQACFNDFDSLATKISTAIALQR